MPSQWCLDLTSRRRLRFLRFPLRSSANGAIRAAAGGMIIMFGTVVGAAFGQELSPARPQMNWLVLRVGWDGVILEESDLDAVHREILLAPASAGMTDDEASQASPWQRYQAAIDAAYEELRRRIEARGRTLESLSSRDLANVALVSGPLQRFWSSVDDANAALFAVPGIGIEQRRQIVRRGATRALSHLRNDPVHAAWGFDPEIDMVELWPRGALPAEFIDKSDPPKDASGGSLDVPSGESLAERRVRFSTEASELIEAQFMQRRADRNRYGRALADHNDEEERRSLAAWRRRELERTRAWERLITRFLDDVLMIATQRGARLDALRWRAAVRTSVWPNVITVAPPAAWLLTTAAEHGCIPDERLIDIEAAWLDRHDVLAAALVEAFITWHHVRRRSDSDVSDQQETAGTDRARRAAERAGQEILKHEDATCAAIVGAIAAFESCDGTRREAIELGVASARSRFEWDAWRVMLDLHPTVPRAPVPEVEAPNDDPQA